MSRLAATSLSLLRLLPRAALFALLLAAPVLAMPAGENQATSIEAPAMQKSGAGFVLLISLQRG